MAAPGVVTSEVLTESLKSGWYCQENADSY